MGTSQAFESIYQPLEKHRQNIRLLHIQPALHLTDPIHCSLSQAFLDGNNTDDGGPHYEALSYAWGTEYCDVPVHLEGQPRIVTVNLYQALQYLRHPSQERVMWIDALCIDQSNLGERTHQVGIMRDVYERAASTTVWLGTSTGDNCALAMRFLERTASDKDLHLDPARQPHAEVEGENIFSSRIIAGLAIFFGNPWWSRVWTIQEWLLSRQTALQHGYSILNGEDIAQVFNNWSDHLSTNLCCVRSMSEWPDVDKFFFIYERLWDLIWIHSDVEQRSLPQLIGRARMTRHAKDSRDKVYGMLGLARGKYEKAIVADYTKSAREAFESATVQMIKQTSSLEVLSCVITSVAPEHDLPTWVPDWTVSFDTGINHNRWMRWLECIENYNASNTAFASPVVCGSGRIRLHGLKADEIDLCSISEHDLDPGFFSTALKFLELHCPRTQGEGTQTCASDLCLALCGSLSYYSREGITYLRSLRHDAALICALEARIAMWNDMSETALDEELLHTELQDFCILFNSMRIGRRLTVTTQGRIAWCPKSCQKGDIIAVLAGGKVPYVLRKNEDDTYRFLGDSYVHGIMDGEVVIEMEAQGRDWETFELV